MERQIEPCPFCGCIPEIKESCVNFGDSEEMDIVFKYAGQSIIDVTHWMPLPESPK